MGGCLKYHRWEGEREIKFGKNGMVDVPCHFRAPWLALLVTGMALAPPVLLPREGALIHEPESLLIHKSSMTQT